jgi:tRNA(His) guanylyltransferase
MIDYLGNYVKDLETRYAGETIQAGAPFFVRIDGRGFSKFTKGFRKPFEPAMIDLMTATTSHLVEEFNAKLGYTQSDEITLLFSAPRTLEEALFGGRVTKLASVIASRATAFFNLSLPSYIGYPNYDARKYQLRFPHFDGRAFSVFSDDQAVGVHNVLLWRFLDCCKNAVSGAATDVFGHKLLQGKSTYERKRMLVEAGREFNTSYPDNFKYGTYCVKSVYKKFLKVEEILDITERDILLGYPENNSTKNIHVEDGRFFVYRNEIVTKSVDYEKLSEEEKISLWGIFDDKKEN